MYNHYASLVQNEEDWLCFIDRDCMFLADDYGHQLEEIIAIHPNVGMFTSITNRVGQKKQCHNGVISNDPNLLNHRKITLELSKTKRHVVSPIPNPISGHLMLIKKKTWNSIGGAPENRGILSVDNTISNRVVRKGYSLMLMEGVYVTHYYRMENYLDKSHLL